MDILKDLFIIFAEDSENFLGFLRISGVNPEEIRELSKDDKFFKEVLNYLLTREDLMNKYCQQLDVDPASIAQQFAGRPTF